MIQTNHTQTSLQELDPDEFGKLVEPYRRELHVHCYRMLGSLQEAEEMVQETFLRAWSRRDSYTGDALPRAWLYKIATNLSIDTLRKRPPRGLPKTRTPAATPEQPIPAPVNEPVWLEPYPTHLAVSRETNPEARYAWDESIRLAFLACLHLLPPYQRAVLILRDVLNWRASEVAAMMDQSLPSVKSALYRARATLAEHYPGLQPETMTARAADEATRELLERYVQAWETADVDALVALLRDDCSFSMPPTPSWYHGRAAIGELVGKTIFSGQARGRWRLAPAAANAQPGFGLYRLDESSGEYTGYGIQALTLAGGRISDIITFRNPALVKVFLPDTPTIMF